MDGDYDYNQKLGPDPDTQRIKRLKLALVIVGIAMILIVVLAWVHGRLTNGGIIVTTNSSQSIIKIARSKVVGDSDDDETNTSPQPLTSGQKKTLDAGDYILSVSQGSVGVSQAVNIKAGKVSQYSINLAGSNPSPELVANVNALSFAVGSSNIYYVDQSTNNLFNIDNQNNLSQLNATVAFQTVAWADSTFGVGQDSSGALYTITNGVVEPLAVPPHDSKTQVNYAVAPDHTVYLAIGKTIYKRTGPSSYDNIFTDDGAPFQIAAVGNLVALNYNPGDNSPNQKNADLTIIQGSSQEARIKIDANSINWSPSGRYLLVGTDESTQLFDASLNPVAVVPNTNLVGVAWPSDTSLIFSSNNQLWQYNFSNQRSQTIAASAPDHLIGQLDLSPDKSYVYLAVESTPNSHSDLVLERFGLQGQKASASIGTLQSNLPWLVGRCLLSVVNYTSPPTIESYGGQPGDNCPQAAQSYVQQLGVDPNSLNYQITGVPPDEPSQ